MRPGPRYPLHELEAWLGWLDGVGESIERESRPTYFGGSRLSELVGS